MTAEPSIVDASTGRRRATYACSLMQEIDARRVIADVMTISDRPRCSP